MEEPQALQLSGYHLHPEVSGTLPCGHPWASTAPHGPECLGAIDAVEPVWGGEREAQAPGDCSPRWLSFSFGDPSQRPPSSACFTFPKISSPRAERTVVTPSHPGPDARSLPSQASNPWAGLEQPKSLPFTAPLRVMGRSLPPKRLVNCPGRAGSLAARSGRLLLLSSIAHHKPDLTMELPRKFSSKL